MKDDRLVHTARQRVKGHTYSIAVYRRTNGMHYAKTLLSDSDIIINDGSSLNDALMIHKNLLPLAISSHSVRRIYSTP